MKGSDRLRRLASYTLVAALAFAAAGCLAGVGGNLKRLYVKQATGGAITAPEPGDLAISVRSATLGNQVLYVRIYQFGASTSKEFADALATGLRGAKGVVLDLRGDPGGQRGRRLRGQLPAAQDRRLPGQRVHGVDAALRRPVGCAVDAGQVTLGVLGTEDLAKYEAHAGKPLQTMYRGHRVITLDWPGQGNSGDDPLSGRPCRSRISARPS